MNWLSDDAVARLRDAANEPDLSGTPYRFAGALGRGGMGAVFLVEDSRLGRRVAMKVLVLPDRSGELEARLLREARVLAQIEHPGIVPVHDVGSLADGRVFYTMKYVEGRRLDEWAGSAASLAERLRLFEKICEAVAFAHARGVLHRDLKPANIMVGPFGEVLVMDWGLAKILRGESPESAPAGDPDATIYEKPKQPSEGNGDTKSSVITGHGTVMGTPGYMSPEQARGEVELLDARSDIFSLGALLRFILTQRMPSGLAPRLDRSLEAICAKACAEQRGSRYSAVQDFGLDISRYLDGQAVGALRESIFDKAGRFYRRYRFFILLILAYLAMRVILVLFLKR